MIKIDIGSTTAKLVVIDTASEIMFSRYKRHNAKTKDVVSDILKELQLKAGDIDACIKATGSVGMGISEQLEIPFVQEVVATTKAVQKYYPDVHSMIDIGGKDAKIVASKTKIKRIVHNQTYEDSITSLKNRLKVQTDYFSKDHYVRDSYFNLDVSEALVKRSLNFLNTFIKEIKYRGYEIKIKNYKTIVVINDIELEVSLREKCNQIKIVDGNWVNTVLKRNGKLCLRYHKTSSIKEWIDNLTGLIETRIPEIVDSLVIQAKKKGDLPRRNTFMAFGVWKKRYKRAGFQQKKECEYKNFMSLFALSNRLHKTTIIRDYIQKYRENAIKNNLLDADKEEWISWATRKADWLDPFIEDDDELLNDINRDSI